MFTTRHFAIVLVSAMTQGKMRTEFTISRRAMLSRSACMKVGRQAVVREWYEWHLIYTAMEHQAWMTTMMQKNSCDNHQMYFSRFRTNCPKVHYVYNDSNYERVQYTRYTDDFIIGVMIYLRLRMKQDRERKQQHSTRMVTNGRNVLQSLIM